MNRIFTRNTLFSLLGIFIFSLSFFVSFGNKAEATNVNLGISDVFPNFSKSVGNGFSQYKTGDYYSGQPGNFLVQTGEFILNTLTGALSWVTGQSNNTIHEGNSKFITDDVKLTLIDTTSNSVSVRLSIAFGNSPMSALEDRDNSGILGDTIGDLGTWVVLYDPKATGVPFDDTNSEGVWFDIGTSTEAGSLTSGDTTNGAASPPIAPTLLNVTSQGLSSAIATKDTQGKTGFERTSLSINLTIGGTTSQLTANTKYIARVRLEGNRSDEVGYSNYIEFTTKSSTNSGSNQNTPIVVDEIGGATNNEADLMSGVVCGILNGALGTPGTLIGCVVHITNWIYQISAWILRGAGWLFDAFASLSISSYMYSNASFITEGWKTIRDLMNMFFIFALLYAAIRIIISKDSAGSIAPLIKNIIVTAILINFSLFIVKIGIDASNITARIFYNAIGVTVTSKTEDPITKQSVTGIKEINLSQGIVSGLGVQQVTSSERLTQIKKGASNNWDSSVLVGILLIFGIIINLTAAGVFFTVGVLFVGRIIGFYMAMLFAPIAFMSTLIPGLEKIKGAGRASWQDNLTKDILLAPLFLFFIWVIIGLASNADFLGKIAEDGSTDFTKALIMIAVKSVVILGLLKAAKTLAEGQASQFASMLNAQLSKALSFVAGTAIGAGVGIATGGAALAGQATLGKWGAGMANDDKLKKRANEGGLGGAWARLKLGAGDKLQTNSFDFRKTMAGKGLEKGFGSTTGVNVDEKGVGYGRTGLEFAGKTATVAASPFTDKRVDFNMEGGYAGAIKRGQEYREKLAESMMVTGQAAEDMDKRAKIWKKSYEDSRDAAEEAAKTAGEQFKEEEFKRAYEAGADYVAGGKTFKGQKKLLNAKEENDRRRRERADYIELEGNTDYGAKKQFFAGTQYSDFQQELQSKKTALGTSFNMQQFLQDYKSKSAANATLVNSLNTKQQIDFDKFKNEYMKSLTDMSTRQKYKLRLAEEQIKGTKSEFFVAGEFRENLFREDFLNKGINTAQQQAVAGIRKKAAEENKQEVQLSGRERSVAQKAYDKANDELTKIIQALAPIRAANTGMTENAALKNYITQLESSIATVEAAIDVHKTTREYAIANKDLAGAQAATALLTSSLATKKKHEEDLKRAESKDTHEKNRNENATKLNI